MSESESGERKTTQDEYPTNPLECMSKGIKYFCDAMPELMLQADFSNESYERIMGMDALGSLWPTFPVALSICEGIKTSVDPLYYANFVDYLMRLNVSRLSRDSRTKKWFTTIRDALGNTKQPPSLDASSVSAPSAPSTNTIVQGHYAAKPKIDVPNYKGTFYGFSTWFQQFENVLQGARVPSSEWIWLMNQSMEPGTTAARMINEYISDSKSYDEIVLAFGKYFDKLTKAKVLSDFQKLWQMKHEDVTMFFLRYRPAIEMMLRFKNIPDKELYPDLYNDFVNMHFLQKIRKSIAVDVRKELRHMGKSENQMDLFSLYELTVRVEDENYGGNSGKKPKDKERNIWCCGARSLLLL